MPYVTIVRLRLSQASLTQSQNTVKRELFVPSAENSEKKGGRLLELVSRFPPFRRLFDTKRMHCPRAFLHHTEYVLLHYSLGVKEACLLLD